MGAVGARGVLAWAAHARSEEDLDGVRRAKEALCYVAHDYARETKVRRVHSTGGTGERVGHWGARRA
jgi:hypothetical protein